MKVGRLAVIGLLVFLAVVFGFYLKTSLSTPINFGDEGFHTRMAQWIAENKEYPVWIPFSGTKLLQLAFARPPVFNILEAGFSAVLGFHEIIIKTLTPFIAVLTGLAVFLLTKRLYNKTTGIIAAIILVGLPSFVTYSIVFYSDMLFAFFASLFALTFLVAVKEGSRKYWLLSSLFAGLAFLTKSSAVVFLVFMPVVFIYLLLFDKTKTKISLFRELFIFGVVFLVIVSPFILRNLYYYQTPLCGANVPIFEGQCHIKNFEDKYQFETRTTQGGSENSVLRFGLSNYINFAYGGWTDSVGILSPVYKIFTPIVNSIAQMTGLALSSFFFLVGLIGGVIILAIRRDHVSSILLILLVMSFILFKEASYRTEDTARHTLAWAALFAVVSSVYWNEVYKLLSKFYKHLGVLVIVLALVFGFQNIVSKLSTMEGVKGFSSTFFEACDWVKDNLPKDSRLLTFWGNRAVYNCQRDISPGIADIRLNSDPDDTRSIAQQQGITHLFIQKFSITPEPTRESYSIAFVKMLEDNPQYFEKVYENGPSLDDCFNRQACDGNIIYKVV